MILEDKHAQLVNKNDDKLTIKLLLIGPYDAYAGYKNPMKLHRNWAPYPIISHKMTMPANPKGN